MPELSIRRWVSGFIGVLTCTTINALTLVSAAVGFTVSGGTTSKTLTVDEDATLSAKALKTQSVAGDGIAGRVFRSVNIIVDDGTTAAHIKCTSAQIWNGDTHAQSDEFAANETSPDGFWSLDDSGSVLRLLDVGLTGGAVGVLAATIKTNLTGVPLIISLALSGGIFAQVRNATTGAYLDITTLVDTGSFSFVVFYVSSA
jgi:hypothetical protein